jgi:predicted RNase H-like HicB family nuclease|tara:strand:+ start:7848 stop:8099 length:252 start_codon:yes stop_codon:yes gene_type:complete
MNVDKIQLDIVIVPEGEGKDRLYSIYSIQFPDVVTQGETIEEAKVMLKEALELYFEEVPEEKEKVIQISSAEYDAPLVSRIFL